MKQYKSPTAMVWLLGRTFAPARHRITSGQCPAGQVSLVPLSAYGKPYKYKHRQVDPNLDMKTAVRDAGDQRMDISAYFNIWRS